MRSPHKEEDTREEQSDRDPRELVLARQVARRGGQALRVMLHEQTAPFAERKERAFRAGFVLIIFLTF